MTSRLSIQTGRVRGSALRPPGVILDRLIQAEVGDVDEAELAKVQSGIVRELLELKGMVG